MSLYTMWSASLPLDLNEHGYVVKSTDARPWNGRLLTDAEIDAVLVEARDGGPQAAFEWLSEHAF